MLRSKSTAVAVLAVAMVFAASASAQEKRIKKSDLPAAVQKSADEQAKGATVLGYNKEVEGGKVAYEVELKVNGHSKDVTMDEQGTVLEIEEQVVLDALPAAVREGLQKAAGKATIGKVESLTKKGALVAYEAVVTNGKKKSEIQVGPDGKPPAHKE
jgi:hypothetical protein